MAILHSDSILKDAALFIVVGHETSANFTSFMIMTLGNAKYRCVVSNIRQEMAEYLENNRKSPEELNFKDMEHLYYLKAVCYEVLRMYPSVPRLKGVVSRDVKLGGIDFIAEKNKEKALYEYSCKMKDRDPSKDVVLRKGSYFFISTLNLHLNEAVYQDPLVFNPERFLSKDNEGERCFLEPDPHKWFPFGFGRRECPGRRFAVLEVMLAMLHILRTYDIRVDDPHCYQTKSVFSLHPANIVSMQATKLDEKMKAAPIPR